ncbi:mechanosensitive ion channel family protein [Rhodococcus tukisamuensis]|uniref:Small conductance mechanosensitive channel n=1 Tax=Rhodococcus tukisamuensis TaxID=168276 RepID=A0A1G6XNI2_9NOCA|nr:mechanosensitive ion channel family protein [Rhodococcus tukisamuensis]SDD79521.1 small conductance mechanosensitive channel [Rhodococcus tukisamuensis]
MSVLALNLLPENTTTLSNWLRTSFLEIVLYVLGGLIVGRFLSWAGNRITDRIDLNYSQGDALVRSEATKHRHALAQVITWVLITIVYVLVTVEVLQRLGFAVSSLVAPATVLGAALGFGAQRVVQDILAGFFIIAERQYGFGDVVSIMAVGAGDAALGTVEDVTLRVTRLRSSDGEVITIPNGQIVKVVNLSKDWARAVVDVPIPATVDINHVNDVLHSVGREAYQDPDLEPLLLDEPSVMGVESIEVDTVNIRMVARTLPGKQFQVGRELRARVAERLRREGILVGPELITDQPVHSSQPDHSS